MSDLPPSPKRAKLDPPHVTAAEPPLRTVELAGRVIAEHAEVATAESATDTNDSARATDGKGKGVEVTVEEVWVTLKLSWARKELLIELCESDRYVSFAFIIMCIAYCHAHADALSFYHFEL